LRVTSIGIPTVETENNGTTEEELNHVFFNINKICKTIEPTNN